MDTVKHTFENLFLQLGLRADHGDIEAFIKNHSLDDDISLDKADFWTKSQAQFIRESHNDDADWSGIVDELDSLLREKR